MPGEQAAANASDRTPKRADGSWQLLHAPPLHSCLPEKHWCTDPCVPSDTVHARRVPCTHALPYWAALGAEGAEVEVDEPRDCPAPSASDSGEPPHAQTEPSDAMPTPHTMQALTTKPSIAQKD
jgi:hypothetical protein